MVVNYRSTLPNFYSDKSGSYVSIDAIVPVLTIVLDEMFTIFRAVRK